MSREFRITLTEDDLFQLRCLRERAESESKDFRMLTADRPGAAPAPRFTDMSREAQRALDCLDMILKQCNS